MSLSAACNFTASASTVSATGTLYAAAGTLCTLALVDSTNVYHGDAQIDCDLIPEAGQQFRLNPHGWSAKFQLPPIDTVLDVTVTVSDVNGSTAQSQFSLVVVKDGLLAATLFGADPTGSVDSLAAVNAAAAALSGTGIAIFFPGGTYSLSALPTIATGAALRMIADASVSFTGAAGAAMAALVSANTIYQAGTVPSPTYLAVQSVQPVDHTKAPFQIALGGASFNSTWDSVLYYGYNADRANTNEPYLTWNIEEDYNKDGTNHVFETYWEFGPANRSYVVRPFFAQLNRATGACATQIAFGQQAGDGLSIVSNGAGAPVPYLSVSAAGVDISTTNYLHLNGAAGIIQATAGSLYLIAASGQDVIVGSPISGNAAPVVLSSSPGVSAATSFSLTAGEQQTPIIQLTGTVPAGGTTITLPNTPGAWWKFSLSAVTLTGSLTFTTGSGTTAVVASADLGTHKRLIDVVVSASNVVDWG